MRASAVAAGVATAVVGVVVLVAWAAHWVALQQLLPGMATMKANTAAALAACGAALAVKGLRRRSAWNRLAAALALAAAVVAAADVAEWVAGVDLRVDQLLVTDAATPAGGHPGRMAPATAASIAAVGLAVAVLDVAPAVGQALAIGAGGVSGLALLGYAYGVAALYRVVPYGSMALHTAGALTVLSAGVLAARPVRCLPGLFTRRSDGGRLARRLLPATVAVPLIAGWACLACYHAGAYAAEFAVALFAGVTIAAFAALVWANASAIDRVDVVRRRVQRDRDRLLAGERAARATAERAVAARDQLLSVVSHELRTPLTPVPLITADLAARGDLPPDVTADLATVRDQVMVEASLINDLLDLVRLRQEKVSLARDVIDLSAVVHGAVGLLAKAAAEQRVTLTADAACDTDGTGTTHVAADAGRVRQIVGNLLSNAVKFTPPGGAVHVTCRATVDAAGVGWAAVAVRDSGVGIAAEAMGRIFAAFEQADASTTRRFGGLGLGLSIARRLAEMHGGTLTADSPGPGQGATFSLHLPTVAAPPAALVPAARPVPPPALAAGLRVLLVEDNRATLRALSRLLGREGHQVVTATSAAEAMAHFDGQAVAPFDVLVSDIGLPDVDGWELMRRVRQRWPAMPGVAMSGFVADADLARSRACGFVAHLGKPLDLPELTAAVADAVGGREGVASGEASAG